jgi:hypothetical protein|eukprot:COSAG01_NODE_3111_length_6570_cov_10.045743_9_plen_354_part_00
MLSTLTLGTAAAAAAGMQQQPPLIDRHAVVGRHCPSLSSINTSEVAVLGNGAFALSVDVTGLQTLNETFSGLVNTSNPYRCRCPAHAEVYFPLMTGADWGWHSFKPPGAAGSKADPFAPPQYGTFWDRWRVSSNRSAIRESWYPTGSAASGGGRTGPSDPDVAAAIEWRGLNPHRISLGQVALRRLDADHGGVTLPIDAAELSGINQTLDLWQGILHSRFSLSGAAVEVLSAVHGEADMLAARVQSKLVAAGSLGVAVSFGGGTGAKSGANWTSAEAHTSEIVHAASTADSVVSLPRRCTEHSTAVWVWLSKCLSAVNSAYSSSAAPKTTIHTTFESPSPLALSSGGWARTRS